MFRFEIFIVNAPFASGGLPNADVNRANVFLDGRLGWRDRCANTRVHGSLPVTSTKESEVNVKYKIEFQYKSPTTTRPQEEPQDEPIALEEGEFFPIPNVGDSVGYLCGGKKQDFKVVSRHFTYKRNSCCIHIVVTDISKEEMLARLKEFHAPA